MKKYNHESWSIDIPKNWSVDKSDEDCISFYSPDENRSLHISDYFKEDGHVTEEEVVEMFELESYQPTNLEYLHGICNREEAEDEVILSWWLYLENHLVFAEYICLASEEEKLSDEIESLIYSLRSVHG